MKTFQQLDVQFLFLFDAALKTLRGMDRDGWGETVDLLEGVMLFHCFDDRIGKAPHGEKVGSDLRVGESEDLLLGAVDGDGIASGDFKGLAVFGFRIGGENQFADIVKKAGGEGDVSLVDGKMFHGAELTGTGGGAQTMVPNSTENLPNKRAVLVIIEHFDAHHETADEF